MRSGPPPCPATGARLHSVLACTRCSRTGRAAPGPRALASAALPDPALAHGPRAPLAHRPSAALPCGALERAAPAERSPSHEPAAAPRAAPGSPPGAGAIPTPLFAGGLALAAVAGAALRALGLGRQVLTGDELHTVNGAVTLPVGEILRSWTFHGADYCVPLTAAFRFLMDRGVVLSELDFRWPSLVASLVTVVAVPWWLRTRIGRAPALVLAALLALSPMLVLYGRIVRSYAPMVLLAAAAVIAFDRWWRRPAAASASAAVAAAALATWFHLGAAPFVLAPLAFAAGARLRGRGPGWGAILALAAAMAGAIALLLAPAWGSLLDLVGLHGRGAPPPLATWLEVAHLQVGTRSTLAVAVATALAVRGTVVLWRRDAAFVALLATLAAGQVLGLVILAPNFLQALVVANRYVLILLPFGLALVAVGAATPVRGRDGRSAPGLQAAAVVVGLGVLFATGPLAGAEYRWSSFTHAQPFMNFLRPGDHVPLEEVPAFYRTLPPGDGPILEAPWTNVGTHSFNAYQHVHHRPLRVGSVTRAHTDPRLALRNTVPARADDLRRSGARYVVVHLDLAQEEARVTTTELRHRERLERLPELWQVLRTAGTRLAAELREAWGPPHYSDASLRVWDLEALPGSAPGADPGAASASGPDPASGSAR